MASVPIATTIADAMKKALETQEVKDAMAKLGLHIRYMDVAGYSEIWDEYGVLVKDLIPLRKQ